MPLPIIAGADLRSLMRDVFRGDATRDDVRDLRRILANLDGDTVRREMSAAAVEHLRGSQCE